MRITRVYQEGDYHTGDTIPLNQNAAGHLIRVLRLKAGDSIQIFNGKGKEFSAKLSELSKKSASIEIAEAIENNTESPITINLIQGISRNERMDFVIQKATELGVNTITTVITERCGVSLNEQRWQKRWQHWQFVAISACEQSGRSVLPEIKSPQTLSKTLEQTFKGECLLLSPEANKTQSPPTKTDHYNLLIGPEGGLTEQEEATAKEKAFKPITLGPRVLRTETAALAAVTAIQCRFGDM